MIDGMLLFDLDKPINPNGARDDFRELARIIALTVRDLLARHWSEVHATRRDGGERA